MKHCRYLLGKPQIKIDLIEYVKGWGTGEGEGGVIMFRTILSCWNRKTPRLLNSLSILLPNRDAVDCEAQVKVTNAQTEGMGRLAKAPWISGAPKETLFADGLPHKFQVALTLGGNPRWYLGDYYLNPSTQIFDPGKLLTIEVAIYQSGRVFAKAIYSAWVEDGFVRFKLGSENPA